MSRAASLAVVALVCQLDCARRVEPTPTPVISVDDHIDDNQVAAAVDNSRTLVVAIVDDWADTRATMTLWTRREAAGQWAAGDSWAAVIGRSGSAWGLGIHSDGDSPPPTNPPYSNNPAPVKHEGDRKSPAGVFAIDRVFGYGQQEVTKMPYQPVDDSWLCIDDIASTQYTKILSSQLSIQPPVDWTSSESMKRDDELYQLVVNTMHNSQARGGGGSCIFLHVWRNQATATSGCTAMPLPTLRSLVSRLDPADRPLFILLPASTYAAWRSTWHLPAYLMPSRP